MIFTRETSGMPTALGSVSTSRSMPVDAVAHDDRALGGLEVDVARARLHRPSDDVVDELDHGPFVARGDGRVLGGGVVSGTSIRGAREVGEEALDLVRGPVERVERVPDGRRRRDGEADGAPSGEGERALRVHVGRVRGRQLQRAARRAERDHVVAAGDRLRQELARASVDQREVGDLDAEPLRDRRRDAGVGQPPAHGRIPAALARARLQRARRREERPEQWEEPAVRRRGASVVDRHAHNLASRRPESSSNVRCRCRSSACTTAARSRRSCSHTHARRRGGQPRAAATRCARDRARRSHAETRRRAAADDAAVVLRGLFDSRLRDRAHSVNGMPTFDVFAPEFMPYDGRARSESDAPRSGAMRRASASDTPLTPDELLTVLATLPDERTVRARLETAFAPLRARAAAHPALATRQPATSMLRGAEYMLADIRVRRRPVPLAGTHRVTAWLTHLDSGREFVDSSVFYARTEDRPSSAIRGAALSGGMYVLACAAANEEALPATRLGCSKRSASTEQGFLAVGDSVRPDDAGCRARAGSVDSALADSAFHYRRRGRMFERERGSPDPLRDVTVHSATSPAASPSCPTVA
jgi:hypothetical protein